jgi:hypothetical protein
MTAEHRETWQRIEREAHAQVQAELEVDERTPLVFGAHIVWTGCRLGRTDSLTPVHRVGFPQVHHAFTACGELIPPPIRWSRLSPAMIRTMKRCHYCEAEILRISREEAA